MSHACRPLSQTGFTPGRAETFGKTPKLAQAEAAHPSKGTLLAARASAPTQPAAGAADTVSEAAAAHLGRSGTPNLWPSLQTTATQAAAKPAVSTLASKSGDQRIPAFQTSYSTQFAAPFEASKAIRSPLRNTALQGLTDLKGVYKAAISRVGEKRLGDIHHHMRERLQGKMGNRRWGRQWSGSKVHRGRCWRGGGECPRSEILKVGLCSCSDNAFKLRGLFKRWDEEGMGLVDLEGFRCEALMRS